MSKAIWIQILKGVGLAALQASPLAPIAPVVIHAIAEAETMSGKSGTEKLAHVVNIATDAAQVAQSQGVKIDPVAVQGAATKAVSTAVEVTNIVHQAHAADPTPAVGS